MIRAKQLCKNFDASRILTDLDLSVQKGSIYGLIGINGAGKTTMINLLTGIYRQDSGEILVDEQPVYDNAKLKSRMGLISDALWFPSGSRLKSMARYYSRLYPLWNQDTFEEAVLLLGLEQEKSLRSFSKGMKKQAVFALTLATQPDYLFLDEPMDGLDPIVRKKVWDLIVDAVSEREMTVLISSHNLRDFENKCDTIGILADGKMRLESDLEDLKQDIHKVQVAFDTAEQAERLRSSLKVLHREILGSLEAWIVKEPLPKLQEIISREKPKIFDLLPLTLEEIFIYQLGGDNDEIKEFFL